MLRQLMLGDLAVRQPMWPALALLLLAAGACRSARPAEPAPAPAPAPRSTPARAARPAPAQVPAEATGPATPTPADPLADESAAVVDRQNAAYNRHDLEAFLATYADSISVQQLGDPVPVVGKLKLRESTEAWFAEAPGARTEVVERMVLGPFVVDRQRVTAGSGVQPLDAIGIYEVREGLIRRVWSIPPPPTPH
jgi:hypothetical protein